MTHDEFIKEFQRGEWNSVYYRVDQLIDYEDKWCHKRSINYWLGTVGMSAESWYESYVPNPGCAICKSRSHFINLSSGWTTLCGSDECRSEFLSLNSAKKWRDPEYREYQSSISRDTFAITKADPEFEASRASAQLESMRILWSDPEHRLQMSKFVSSRNKEDWVRPEYRRDKYLSICSARGITRACVYVGVSKDHLKFGVSENPEVRLSKLNLECHYISSELDVNTAADIECKVATEFKELIYNSESGVSGYTEYRNLNLLSDITSYIMELENGITALRIRDDEFR